LYRHKLGEKNPKLHEERHQHQQFVFVCGGYQTRIYNLEKV